MRNLPWPKRLWMRVLIVVLVLVLVPYVFSRATSSQRCVSIHASGDGEVGGQELATRPLRIASYNIAHGRGVAESNWAGGDRATRLARLDDIAVLLKEIDADIVVLNEVDFDSSWSHSINQAEYLAAKAGYRYRAEQRNLDFRVLGWTWRFGNAVLSRRPIDKADVIDFPAFARWEEWAVGKKKGLICQIRTGDSPIQLVAAHLSHRSEDVRVQSAETIVHFTKQTDLPTFVAGDMNSTPGSFPGSAKARDGRNAIEEFDRMERFGRLPETPPVNGSELTFSTTKPASVIDWILIPSSWQFAEYRVIDSQLSDHRPVVADVSQ